jgi:hypothetical protein
MKTVIKNQDCGPMESEPKRISRTVKTASRKRKRVFYPDLNEFLSLNQITTVNEHGVKGIYGRRIC